MKAALLVLFLSAPALAADLRPVTLADAVELALRTDPAMDAAYIDRDRTKWATLRTQLDRITLRVDGQLQELWNKVNIGGSTLGACSVGGFAFSAGPKTCASSGGMFTASADQSPSGGQGLFNLTAQLNVPLFSGFRVEATVKRAQKLEEAALVTIRRQRRDTALAAARSFWTVRRLELLLDVQRAQLLRLSDSEAVASGRVKAGLAPPIDRNRATVRRLQQAAQVLEYEGQIKETESQLGVALGLTGGFQLEGGYTFPPTIPATAEELVQTARHDRPEILVAQLRLDAARQSIRVTRANLYPQLAGVGLFQFGNNQFSIGTGARDVSSQANPFAGLSGSLTIGGSLNYNFFDMLTTYTTQRDAQYEAARLAADQRRVERVVDTDVVAAHAKVTRLFGKRVPLHDSLELARDNIKILEARYKSGDALIIELLDAQVELAAAEASLVDVESQLELAWIELRASMGEVPGRR
ncbi:MAG: TolC family protein [Polyangia bacterium]